MSLIDAPIALLDRVLSHRAKAVQADDPIVRMVARTSGRLRPEGDYRRRLRGQVVNQYVAMREGFVSVPAGRREMGRLGRSVLYATFALATSVSAVAAASTSSLPGDPLYGVKREVEELRIEIAPPSVRPALVAMALNERLSEVEQLAADQRWALIPAASADADAAERRLVAMTGTLPADEVASLIHHQEVLIALLATAPAAARNGLLNALAASSASHGQGTGATGANSADHGSGQGNGQGGGAGQGQGNGQPANGSSPSATPETTPTPTRSPRPTASPKPTPDEQTPSSHPTHSPAPAQGNQP